MRVLNLGVARLAAVTLWMLMLLSSVAQAQTGSTLKVLDWNTHHGVGTDGVYNLGRFVTWIARSGAHVVSLNEVEAFTGWGNEDQPARYAALLKAATGKTWYYKFAEREGGTKGQGNLILSTFPFEATASDTLSYSRSVARAQIVVNGVRVNLFSTHLDPDSSARRAQQMAELKSWAGNFSQQHIFAGDFNAWPGAAEIATMTAVAYDAWAIAKAAGTATAYAGNEAGNTRNSRIDYIWYSKNATRLILKGAQVFDTRDGNGVMPSDHRPVMATFQVGAATVTVTETPVRLKAAADFDGDLKADPTVYRSATGEWFSLGSTGAGLQIAWGTPSLGDVPVAGDFDGDGRADVAVFRPADGTWHLRSSKTGAATVIKWGTRTDRPVPGDYDGDGRTDVAVFRPADGVWYVRYSNTGATTGVQWGSSTDVPVPGDYDGDGKTDAAVFRPGNATWYVRYSSTKKTVGFQWGNADDITVPGDYDGDGKTDGAVFRPASGTWFVRYSSTGGAFGFQWGSAADRPVAGDYNGDGRTDIAVFRPSNGVWYLRYSGSGATTGVQWGASTDRPLLSR